MYIQKLFKSFFIVVLVLINTFSLNASEQNPLNFTDIEKEYLKIKKELTICVQPHWLPYEGIEHGKFIGISADYLNIISQNIDVPLKVITANTNQEVIKKLKQGQCDLKPIAVPNVKGKMPYISTEPYNFNDYSALVTKIDQPFISDINKYTDKTFAVIDGRTRFTNVLKKHFPNIKLIKVKNIDEGFNKVLKGEIFGLFGKSLSVSYHINNYYPSKLKIINEFYKVKVGIGVHQEDKILLNIIQKSLDSIGEKEVLRIRNDWTVTTVEKKFDYTFLWYIFAIFILIILAFFYKQFLLQKRIKDSKELIDATTEAIIIHDQGKCIDVNQSALDMFGYKSKEEFNGNHILLQVAPESKELVKKNMCLDDTTPYEATLLKKDGTKFYGLVHGKNIYNNQLRLASVTDITIIKTQEQLLAQQSKMVAMGEMIGNIAHQWRQPLSVISTSATGLTLEKKYGTLTDERFISTCEAINDNAQYLSNTIDDFKNFIKGDRKIVKFNLLKNVDSFLKLVEGTIKNHNIHIKTDISPDIFIENYPNELIQCFLNLFNNSKDAFDSTNESKYIFISANKAEDTTTILFQDNAGGIPENILPRIFEPYFTTKHPTQGTGLGLNMTYKLIYEGMNGTIKAKNITFDFDDTTHTGAQFTIILP